MAAGDVPDRRGVQGTPRLFRIIAAAGPAALAMAGGAISGILAGWCAGLGYAFISPALGRDAVSRAPMQACVLPVAVIDRSPAA